MWLMFFKFTRWLYQTLNSDMRPWQIALGVTIGALAGLLPLGLGTLCVFVAILLVNVHFGSATFSFGFFRLVGWALQGPVIRPLGDRALEGAPQQPLISLAQTPILSWLRLDYNDVAGAIALWVIIALPLFFAIAGLWSKYQDKMKAKWANSKLLKWLSKLWLFKILRFVFIGATPA
ncbi:MAG: hypothetical protein KF754_13170 [Planctomycetes bacterium]|nr:hypothetical protein [Planctomycetota bacterium]